MTMAKRIVAIVLCIMMLSSMLVACGARRTKGLEFELSNDGKYYYVSKYNDRYVDEIVIPSVYKGKPVTGIANKAFYCVHAKSIIIPDSVTIIGDNAFALSYIENITIPGSVKTIEYNAFYQCHYLKSIVIEKGVTSIGESAFYCCCSLTSVTLPNTLTYIGKRAFDSCESLKSITIPKSVTSMGSGVFYDSGLESLYYTGDIADWCQIDFEGYILLNEKTDLYINNELITELNIPEGVTSIGNYAFARSNITKVVIPNSVTSIGDWTFYACNELTSITIPEGVTFIGQSAFRDCTNLTSVTLPASLQGLYTDTFKDCTSLNSITFRGTIEQWKEFGYYAYNRDRVVYCSDGFIAEDRTVTYY